jgi:DNA polymerase (family 10)
MENPEVAQIFDEVADLLDLQGANPFRIRAYRGAARTVRDLSEPLAQIVEASPDKLTELPGIGETSPARLRRSSTSNWESVVSRTSARRPSSIPFGD